MGTVRKFQIIEVSSHKKLKKRDSILKSNKASYYCRVINPCSKQKKVIFSYRGEEYWMPTRTFDLLCIFGLNKVKREVDPYG